ncbi:HTH-type transcriptional regulator ChbR [Flavobacteriaceae bacterium UJ101]|nr:HTH-type transcriptional regulator ChbR [Flavobacteriaceae bacterium UJ101]
MKQKFQEITFENNTNNKEHFDLVTLEELLEKKVPGHNQFDHHKLSFFALILITKGKGIHNINFHDYSFKKGTLFTIRKDNIHKFYKSHAEGTLLVFTENFIINHLSEVEASKVFLLFNEMLSSPRIQLEDKAFQEIINLLQLIHNEYLEIHDEYSKSAVRNLVQVIVVKLFRIKSENNTVLINHKSLSMFLKFQEMVERDYVEQKKVLYYADALGVTSKTLNNVTQKIINKSAKSLINDVVILQSKRLIKNTTHSLTEVAYQVGFDDPTNFFKFFKKYTGVSPGQFNMNE